MISEVLFGSLLYWLFALIVVFPPTEVATAGLTVEALLGAQWLGSESITFIHYHIRRSAITCIIHTLLLPGYVLTLMKIEPSICDFLDENFYTKGCIILLLLSLLPTLVMCCVVWYWQTNEWERHPLTSKLAVYARDSTETWKSVASNINTEFRSIDKFTSGGSSVYKIAATDNWLIKVTTYRMDVIQLRDAVLSLEDCHYTNTLDTPTPTTPTPSQLLTIKIIPVIDGIAPFSIRLSSVEFGELERKVVNPIVNARSVVIKQSLSDYFLETFTQTISLNPPAAILANDRQPCFGCQQTLANVSLKRRCGGGGGGGGGEGRNGCQECQCRPMWCVSCLGKWFASRQDQQNPESWLGSRAPCPTCRSPFCLLDVSVIS